MLDLRFIKARPGTYRDMPAVVMTDKSGRPFLWFTAENHRKAIAAGIAYCDAHLKEITNADH
jgi:hypothetical protein